MRHLLFATLLGTIACNARAGLEPRHFLTVKEAATVSQGWNQTKTNLSITGGTLRVAGARYEKGIGTHPKGEIAFNLAKKHKNFRAEVGVDDAGGPTGSVVFSVWLDGKEAFNSGIVRAGQKPKPISLDVTAVSTLTLAVTDAGDGMQGDHADWLNPSLDMILPDKHLPAYSTAGFHAIPGSPRTVENFGTGWRFHKGDAPGAQTPAFDDSQWEAAAIPHGLEVLTENASGGRNYQGKAWYRKRFDLPPPPNTGRAFIYFEAVMGTCTVWINGKEAAQHFGGYLPFAVDATPLLNPNGKNNLIALCANNADDPNVPPGKPQSNLDFTYLGGIYRETYLIQTGPVHISLTELSPTPAGGGVFVAVKDIEGATATIEIRTELQNSSKTPAANLTVRNTLETLAGKKLAAISVQNLTLAPGALQTSSQTLIVDNAEFWHPDSPTLHHIRTEILKDGKIIDSFLTRFGIRLFEMRGQQGFFINKKQLPYRLSGVNRHQDYVHIGNALPNSGQWRDAKLLREGGVTIVRAAHYPLDPAFYDACDALGLLTTTANPGWQFYEKNTTFEQRIYADTRNLVRRDRNHPSMLLWETALNETPHQPPHLLKEMHRIAHEEFPFPGLYTVADVDEAKHGGLDFYYHGGYHEPKNSFNREYGDGGEVDNFGSQNATTRVKREWGEHALLKQAAIRARDLGYIYTTPPVRIGAALWCGIDHQRGYHNDPFWGGLLDNARIPRYSYYLFKSQYHPDYTLPGIETGPMVKIAHEITQISDPNITIYTNCEEVRLTWLGKDLGTQKPDRGYKGLPHPPVTFTNAFDFAVIKRDWRGKTGQITLIAEGLIGGKVVAKEIKRYPEYTRAISLAVDDQNIALTADGSDFVPVRATVTDAKGLPKVLASDSIFFEVEGPAEIVSGPLSPNNPVKTEFGTATILLRAKPEAGVIKVRASAPKLTAAEIYLKSVPAPQPLRHDPRYLAGSKPLAVGAPVFISGGPAGTADQAELQKLRDEVLRMQREVTSKEQDIMDLRSRLK